LTFDIDVDGSNLATFTYDARGLLATRTLENGTTSTYTYDAAARLQAMRGIVPVTYSLNATGQRTGRHDAAFGPESYAYDAIDQVIGANYGGVRSEGFAYDAMGNRQSASDTATGITAYTVRADNAYTSVGGISTQTDDILAKSTVAGTVYYHRDGLGSTVALSDASGQIVERYRYDVFGRVEIRSATGESVPESMFGSSFFQWDHATRTP
jgi:YD repeat-containing protein